MRAESPANGRRNQQFGHASPLSETPGDNPETRRKVPFAGAVTYGPAAYSSRNPACRLSPSARPRPEDAGLILSLLTELAAYEKLPITLTEEEIAFDFFGLSPLIECDLAFEGDQAAWALSPITGPMPLSARRGGFMSRICLCCPAFRGRGYGKAMLHYLARKGLAAGAARLEWQVLDWNAPCDCLLSGHRRPSA